MKKILIAVTAFFLLLTLLSGCIAVGTPGGATATDATEVGGQSSGIPLILNEYSTESTPTFIDCEGDCSPWVEIFNSGSEAVSLAGFFLSDNPLNPDKWTFPEVSIEAGAYLIVFLAGKEITYTEGGELHADFTLTGKESVLSLSTPALVPVDTIEICELVSNLSRGYYNQDKALLRFFSNPTPGAPNEYDGFESIDSARYQSNKELVITETAAVNLTGASAPDGGRYDFIELYNPSDKPVSLNSYRLCASGSALKQTELPEKTLEPKNYYVIYCTDDKSSVGDTSAYIDVGVNRYGETLRLLLGKIVTDSFETGRLADELSSGRIEGGTEERVFFETQTPGKKNSGSGLKFMLASPVFSSSGGYVNAGTQVTISACDGAQIRYTLDGSTPVASSPLYSTPITVSETVSVRARAYMDGHIPSEDASASFIVGRRHDMSVVFLTTNKDNLFDYNTGIFADGPNISAEFPYVGANFWQDWERDVRFEYMDEGGVMRLGFNAGIKVFGQYSRANDQKSVSINLRDKYGPTEVCYPFFADGEVNVFSALVLRNSGQDYNRAFIRDAYCAEVIREDTDVDIMNYRPVVVYINGEYYGIYDLREKVDEDYLANRRGIDPDNVDMIKGTGNIMNGDKIAYREMLDYVKTHDLTVPENYDYICSIVDIDELITYWAAESFFGNTDTGNIKFYRERTEGAKWRWIFFDVDWALTGSTYQYNMVDNYIDPAGHGVGKMFDTSLMCALIKNKDFKEKLLTINGRLYQTTFREERLLEIYDRMIEAISTEMPYHIARWGVPPRVSSWEYQCQSLREIIAAKPAIFLDSFVETYNLTDAQRIHYFGE